jgi:hypothetical protein
MGDGGEDNPVLYDTDTGETKDDISVPEGDMREKMKKLFADEEEPICAFLRVLSCLLHRIPAIYVLLGRELTWFSLLGVTVVSYWGEEGIDSFREADKE